MKELVDTPIRVTEIQPGMVETSFSITRMRGDKDKAAAVSSIGSLCRDIRSLPAGNACCEQTC